MASKTLINGTGYAVKGGRVLVGGTGYQVKKGRTLIGGTGYNIPLGYTWGKYSIAYTESSKTLQGGQNDDGWTGDLVHYYINFKGYNYMLVYSAEDTGAGFKITGYKGTLWPASSDQFRVPNKALYVMIPTNDKSNPEQQYPVGTLYYGNAYYIQSDSTSYKGIWLSVTSSDNWVRFYMNHSETLIHYWYTAKCGQLIGEVTSDNATAYPDNGISGGYWYIRKN